MTFQQIQSMSEKDVVAGLRGAFDNIDDEMLYSGVGTLVLLLQGMKQGCCIINDLDTEGHEFCDFVRDPANRDNPKIRDLHEAAFGFFCRFLNFYEATVIVNKNKV